MLTVNDRVSIIGLVDTLLLFAHLDFLLCDLHVMPFP